MKNFLSFVGVVALILALLGVCSLAFDMTKGNGADEPDDSVVGLPDDTGTGNVPTPDDGTDGTETPTVRTITVVRACSQGGAAGCSCGQCPEYVEYTFEIEEGDTFATLFARETADGDYAEFIKECEGDGTPEVYSLDGYHIVGTDETVTNDTVLVDGAVYVNFEEVAYTVMDTEYYCYPNTSWSALALRESETYRVDGDTERILSTDGTRYLVDVDNGGAPVVFTAWVESGHHYYWYDVSA